MKKGFTLIELLVVIAIIAILAAILFPVFAQAKEAAKRTVALSNSKEVSTGMLLYMNDADDVTPTSYCYDGGSCADIYALLQPYEKNMDIFFSPDWNLQTSACNNSTSWPGVYSPTGDNAQRCVALGYNWGFGVWAGGALVGYQRSAGNGSNYIPGISGTSVEAPAQLASFGDTYTGQRYNMSAIGDDLLYSGAKKNSSLRYGGRFTYAYLDGHAKNLPMKGYAVLPKGANPSYPNGLDLLVPKDTNATVPLYCAQVNGQVQPSNLGLPLPDMGCGDFINLTLSGKVLPLAPWQD